MKGSVTYNTRQTRSWFRKWARENHLDTIFEENMKSRGTFYFKNVTRHIEIWVGAGEINISVTYRHTCWDFLQSIDLYPAKDAGGYYCEECLERPIRYYKSLEELFIKHTFEQVLDWYLENIKKDKSLYIMKHTGGSTWARIFDNEEVHEDKESTVRIIPLFITDQHAPSLSP